MLVDNSRYCFHQDPTISIVLNWYIFSRLHHNFILLQKTLRPPRNSTDSWQLYLKNQSCLGTLGTQIIFYCHQGVFSIVNSGFISGKSSFFSDRYIEMPFQENSISWWTIYNSARISRFDLWITMQLCCWDKFTVPTSITYDGSFETVEKQIRYPQSSSNS